MGFDHLFSYFSSTFLLGQSTSSRQNKKIKNERRLERERERKQKKTARQENRINKQGQQHLNSWRRMKNNAHTHTSAAFEKCKRLCKEEKRAAATAAGKGRVLLGTPGQVSWRHSALPFTERRRDVSVLFLYGLPYLSIPWRDQSQHHIKDATSERLHTQTQRVCSDRFPVSFCIASEREPVLTVVSSSLLFFFKVCAPCSSCTTSCLFPILPMSFWLVRVISLDALLLSHCLISWHRHFPIQLFSSSSSFFFSSSSSNPALLFSPAKHQRCLSISHPPGLTRATRLEYLI